MIEIIEKIEEEKIFSIMNISGSFNIEDFFKRKNLSLIKSVSSYSNNTVYYEECLFRTVAGFYLYFSINGKDLFNLQIYHKVDHLNEILIFLKQIIKK